MKKEELDLKIAWAVAYFGFAAAIVAVAYRVYLIVH
jgi:hypothetical protein